jgi:hypothetical protein
MTQDEKYRADQLAYDAHLDSLISGLSVQDLRALSDKIIYRIQGLEEHAPMPAEVKENIHAFVEGVNENFDSMPLPTEDEANYFLNKAKAIKYDLSVLAEDANLVWSWLEENEKRGRLTEEQVHKLVGLRWAMYYDAGLGDLRHFTQNLATDYAEGVYEWLINPTDEPTSDKILLDYRDRLLG